MGGSGEQTTGYSYPEVNGKPVADIFIPPDEIQSVKNVLENLLAGQFPIHHENHWLTRTGQRRLIAWSNTAIVGPDTQVQYIIGTGIDITERKRAEHLLHKTNQSLKLLSDHATRLLRAQQPDQLIHKLATDLVNHLGLDTYINLLITDNGQRLRLNSFSGFSQDVARRVEYLDFGQSISGTVAQRRCRVIIENAQHSLDPNAELIRSLNITAYASFPLLARESLVGTLAFGSRRRTSFSPDDIELMQAACDQIALALERSRLISELLRRAQELAQASAAKDQFLAALSHELRTPLTPVLLSAQSMAADPSLPPAARDELALIGRNVQLEARLIDDLLDLTRITKGKLELHLQPTDVHAVLRQAIHTCTAGADKAASLDIRFDPAATSHWVHADPIRLEQVFWNLINNAIKFTPASGTITIRTHNPAPDSPCADGHPALVVQVADTGIGIAPDLLPRIFDAFEQGGATVTRRFGGLGLGLAISRAIIQRLDGSIVATSDGLAKGATFVITLTPIPAPSASAPKPLPASMPAIPDKPVRILLVEDHDSTRYALKRILESYSHRVTAAATLADALAAAQSQDFDLLITDLGLPDGSGAELMQHFHPRNIPGIALSGYGTEQDIQNSINAGFRQHLTKPVDLARLDAAIRSAATQHS